MSIPSSLVAAARWVVWRFDPERKKTPVDREGRRIDATDAAHWLTYAEASAAVEAGSFDGVGFVMGDTWAYVDLDDCLEGDDRHPNAFAAGIVRALETYTERSPSGTGLKLILVARGAKNYARKGLEIKFYGGYSTITGDHLPGTPTEPQVRGPELTALIKKEFKGKDAPVADPAAALAPPDAPTDGSPLIEGNRNVALTAMAGKLRRAQLDDAEILAALTKFNTRVCRPPLDAKELKALVVSVARYAPATAERAVDQMNAKHAVVLEAGKCVVLSHRRDEQLERTVYDRSTFEDIRNFYKSRKILLDVGGKPKETSIGTYWLNHPGRREYESVVFDPEGRHAANPRMFNLWQGFQIQPAPGDWSRFRAHLQENICDGQTEVYTYLERWIARMFQKPGRPGEVAVAMAGKQGTGKSIVGRILGPILGQHYLHTTHASHLAGHFNAHLQDAVFVFADEAIAPSDRAGESALKALITEPRVTIERKGKDAFTVRNVLHLMLASNHEWMISANTDERRYLMLNVAHKRARDDKYFHALMTQMEHGGRAAFLHDMLHLDLTGWNHRNVPNTAALDAQKLSSLDPLNAWWDQCLESGQILPGKAWADAVDKTAVYVAYTDTLTRAGVNRKSMETSFWTRLRTFLPEALLTARTTNRGRLIRFPSLAACRALHWRKFPPEGVLPLTGAETERTHG